MAANAAQLWIKVQSKVDDGVKGVQRVERSLDQLEKKSKTVSDFVGGLEKKILGLGLAALGTAAYLAKSAADEETAYMRLFNAIENAGTAIDHSLTDTTRKWVDAQAAATGILASELIPGLTTLIFSTNSYEEAMRRLTLAINVHRATGQDLASVIEDIRLQTAAQVDLLERQGVWTDRVTQLDIDAAQAGAIVAKTTMTYAEALAAVKSGGEGLNSVLKRVDSNIETGAQSAMQANMAQALLAASTYDYAKALAAVKYGGQGAQNLMRRLGIETREQAYSTNILASRWNVGKDAASKYSKGTGGALDKLRVEWDQFTKSIARGFLPTFDRAIAFSTKAISGFHRWFKLFTVDAAGPRIKKLSDAWKAVFGKEMPGFLKAIEDGFTAIADRIDKFVDDLNSTDESSVRGAFQKLADDVPGIIKRMFDDIGTEFDRLGPMGTAAKLLLITLGSSQVTTPILEVASAIAGIAASLGILAVSLSRLGVFGLIVTGAQLAAGAVKALFLLLMSPAGLLTGTIFLVIAALVQTAETVALVITNWDKFKLALMTGQLNSIPVFGFFFEKAQNAINLINDLKDNKWGSLLSAFLTTVRQIPLFGLVITLAEAAWNMIDGVKRAWDNMSQNFQVKISIPKIEFTPPWAGLQPPDWWPFRNQPAQQPFQPTPIIPTPIIPGGETVGPQPPGGGPKPAVAALKPVSATLDDIYAAYNRITGSQINFDYAKEILNRGFNYLQVATGNPFLAEGAIATGSRGINATIGEAGEPEAIVPLSRAREFGFGGSGVTFERGAIVIQGDIDSRDRVNQVGREMYRQASALGKRTLR